MNINYNKLYLKALYALKRFVDQKISYQRNPSPKGLMMISAEFLVLKYPKINELPIRLVQFEYDHNDKVHLRFYHELLDIPLTQEEYEKWWVGSKKIQDCFLRAVETKK